MIRDLKMKQIPDEIEILYSLQMVITDKDIADNFSNFSLGDNISKNKEKEILKYAESLTKQMFRDGKISPKAIKDLVLAHFGKEVTESVIRNYNEKIDEES